MTVSGGVWWWCWLSATPSTSSALPASAGIFRCFYIALALPRFGVTQILAWAATQRVGGCCMEYQSLLKRTESSTAHSHSHHSAHAVR